MSKDSTNRPNKSVNQPNFSKEKESDSLGYWEKEAEELMKKIEPAPENALEGDSAAEAAEFKGITASQVAAVRHYSADQEKGQYQVINNFLRRKTPIDHKSKKALDELREIFMHYHGTKSPIRIFRGIPRWLAQEIIDLEEYGDMGYCSASTSLAVAMKYSDDSKSLLIIDLKEGYPALSIEKFARKPHEKEILLNAGVHLFLKKATIVGEYYLFYVGN